MESKKFATFMVMMLMIGNLMVETEALDRHQRQRYLICFAYCNRVCLASPWIRNKFLCPSKCAAQCVVQYSFKMKPDEINQIDHFCEDGCITLRCVSLENQSKFFLNNHKFLIFI